MAGTVGFLTYGKSFLPKESLMAVYRSIVEPQFLYCCSVWGCCGSKEATQLKRLQSHVARVISNTCRPLIQELGWKTIKELINEETKTMACKYVHELAPEYRCGLFTPNPQLASRNLINTAIGQRLSKKNISKWANIFFLQSS